jgi:plastocyanin
MRNRSASGRAVRRPGAGILFAIVVAVAACEAVGGGATIELDTADVQLERGVELHEVTIRGTAAADSLLPARVAARPGDAVRFTIDDHRTHAIGFDVDRLEPAVRDYLESTNQLRGPPLVNRGGAWIVILDGAPPGRYPFLCRSHDARGLLVVEPGD